ncbi:hypothetical protein AB0M10_29820 [Streptomyces sp. NPDC051840]|uniref:hypothetical protein n=1 Tax=unclassified Streptomyces TaxID=2593676 RepID=UPI0034287D26
MGTRRRRGRRRRRRRRPAVRRVEAQGGLALRLALVGSALGATFRGCTWYVLLGT